MDMKTNRNVEIDGIGIELTMGRAEREHEIKKRTRQTLYGVIEKAIENDRLIDERDALLQEEEDIVKNADALINRVKHQLTKQEMAKMVDKAKFMFLVYMAFYSSLLIVCILVFGGYVKNPVIANIEIPLILTVNLAGSVIVLCWVAIQYGNDLKKCWKMKSLYTPLIAHMVDTASDLGTMYVYYQNWQDGGDEEFTANDYLQFFLTSLGILIAYRVISATLLYYFSGNKGVAMMQFLDLYIFEVLAKSHVNKKQEPTSVQRYVQGLEAYLESFPQLILSTYFIVNKLSNNQTTSSIIWFSVCFSLLSVTQRIISEDTQFFKPFIKVRDADFRRKVDCPPKCCVNWKYIVRVLYRYCDVIVRVLGLIALWRNVNGFTVTSLLFVEFIGSLIFGSIYTRFYFGSFKWIFRSKSIAFKTDSLSCIAVMPLVTSDAMTAVALIYKMVSMSALTFLGVDLYWDEDFRYLAILLILGYIYVTIVTFGLSTSLWCGKMCFVNGRGKLCCCRCYCGCRRGCYPFNLMPWLRSYGSNARSFAGVECIEDFQNLTIFGYNFKPDHVHKGGFDTMRDIEVIYNATLDGADTQTKKEIEEAWRTINHPIKGSLIHQVARNIVIPPINVRKTLHFVVNVLEYDPSQAFQYTRKKAFTPLQYAKTYGDPTMVKILNWEYLSQSTTNYGIERPPTQEQLENMDF